MPAISLAIQTVVAIEKAIAADQGTAYRGWLQKVLPHMDDAYRPGGNPFRKHLGASAMGNDCGRALWYGFRWATQPHFEGRMLRLFNRGHLEEARMIAALLTIGVQVVQQDENGKQFRISELGGHVGGSGDGRVYGCPDIGPVVALSEYKTHNDKSFAKLAGDNWHQYVAHLVDPRLPKQDFTGAGVREAKFEHYVQMQVYMRKMGLPVGLYMAVNKNNDSIYAEVVYLDSIIADQMLGRAIQIVPMHTPPARRKGASPGYYGCKFCDHKQTCVSGMPPARNCRTCQYSQPDTTDGQWYCRHPEVGTSDQLTEEQQYSGCSYYQINGGMLQ